jgi:hypothetical protein
VIDERKTPESGTNAAVSSHGSLIGMLSWRVFGPFLLIGTLILIAQNESWFHVWDVAFLGTLALMIGGRYIEQRSGSGRTIYDEPSTWRHFAVYARNLVIVGLVLWIAVKALTAG